ncbi:MAG: 4Fe-4S binding protein [Planctomycetes bacterium]|nr:4Fe-4S binding protein [Planctomycetota bacterium]
MNLLNARCVRSLLGSRWFPIVPQLIMLVVFGLLIAGGIGVSTDNPDFAKQLRNTNLANLIIWSYWWPLIIIAAILLGRVWCMVCPMELVTSLAGRIGLRQKAPQLFKSGWVITIFYAVILLVGVHTLTVHRVPERMALYLLMLLVVAAIVGLIFEKRAFCSYVCPVGHLLGLYALVSPFEWRADDVSVCKACKTKDCVVKKNHYRITGRSCTSNLYPATIKDNRDCLLCTQCLKACPSGNLRLSTRRPFADFFAAVELRAAQVGFIVLVSGFVVYEILSEWKASKHILTWVPDHIADALGIAGPMAGFVSAVVMFVIFPGILFLTVGVLAKVLSGGAGAVVKTFALLVLPTMAGAHLIKAILKMTSRIPYWPYVFSDPKGVATAQKILDGTLVLDKSVPGALYPVVSCSAAAVLLIALTATLLIFCKSPAVRKLDATVKVPLLFGTLAYWSIFGLTVFVWRF